MTGTRAVRILCDHNVNEKYTETFRRTDWITVTTEREELPIDEGDVTIMAYAAAHDWVVFTSDETFDVQDDPDDAAGAVDLDAIDCGVVIYHQQENPSPGAVLDALRAIAEGYSDHSAIREYVPGNWV